MYKKVKQKECGKIHFPFSLDSVCIHLTFNFLSSENVPGAWYQRLSPLWQFLTTFPQRGVIPLMRESGQELPNSEKNTKRRELPNTKRR